MKKDFNCMKILAGLTVVISTVVGFAPLAEAAVSPLSVSIAPPIQFPTDKYTITGARISVLWGRHRDIYGLDLGAVGNVTDGQFVGVGVSGLFNYTKGHTTALGLQLAGGANINKSQTTVLGLQAALGANINRGESSVVGLQFAAANLSDHTTIYGIQAGVYNTAREVYGFQIGLVNRAESLHGVQLGLINFHTKGVVGVSPILNIGF